MSMSASSILSIAPDRLVSAVNGGLFVSRGGGIHPTRVIDTHELIFIRSGELAIREGRTPFHVAAGQHLILRPGREHAGLEPYSPDLSFYWFHFRLPDGAASRSRQALRPAQHGRPRRPDRMTELMHRFLDDQKSGRMTSLAADLLMMLMLCEAADGVSADANAVTPEHTLAARAESYIAAHADQPISTSSIAVALQCNPDYLGQVFRAAFGQTITDAIHHQRLLDARKLLLDGSMNIDQVARAAGFGSAGYFRRVFQRAEGLSPRRYRKLHLRLHINWR